MPRKEDIQHSILIVTGSERFDALIRKTLAPGRFMSAETRRNAASARRAVLERYYDIIVVDSPLPDESGLSFAMDAAGAGSVSVLLVGPADRYEDILEQVTDAGILAVATPLTQRRLGQAVRYLTAEQDRIRVLQRKLQAAEEKAEETRIVTKAKFLLVEQRHMTEDEAHRLIGRQAMNNGVSRKKIAEQIIDEME